jgi:hypothetical protein
VDRIVAARPVDRGHGVLLHARCPVVPAHRGRDAPTLAPVFSGEAAGVLCTKRRKVERNTKSFLSIMKYPSVFDFVDLVAMIQCVEFIA